MQRFSLVLTKSQLDNLMAILDIYVKAGGLSVLQSAVEAYNVLNSVVVVKEPPVPDADVPF